MSDDGATPSSWVTPPVCYPPTPSFDFQTEAGTQLGLAYLEDHGYVVAKGVLSADEVAHAKFLFWEWAEVAWEGVARGDVSTWNCRNWGGDKGNGIVSSQGIGHSDFLWFVRSRPAVKQVFAAIWETDELLTSFDGCNVFRPWALEPRWRTQGGWYHVDQNHIYKPGKHCVQGLVSMFPATQQVGGLTVIPKSHNQHEQIGRRLSRCPVGDYISMPRGEPVLQTPGVLVQCQAGDLLLWDSRTVHCNSPGKLPAAKTPTPAPGPWLPKFRRQQPSTPSPSPLPGGPQVSAGDDLELPDQKEASGRSNLRQGTLQKKKPDLIRLVAYVCMTPLRMAKGKAKLIVRRKHAVLQRQTTTHWPHEFCPSSSSLPEDFYAPSRFMVSSLVTGNATEQWDPQPPLPSSSASWKAKVTKHTRGGVALNI